MPKIILTLSMAILLPSTFMLLTSCGGGGTDTTTSAENNTSPNTNTQSEPDIITETYEPPREKCSYSNIDEESLLPPTLVTESEYDGDIKFNCSYDSAQPTAQQYFLINGVPSLNIIDLKRETMIVSDCKLGNEEFKDTLAVSFNYKSGVVTTTGESNRTGHSSCSSIYQSPLETTISAQESIKLLFDTWGIDVSQANKEQSGLIETNCPQTTSSSNNPDEAPVCKIEIKDVYTITDDSGKIHTINKKLSY